MKTIGYNLLKKTKRIIWNKSTRKIISPAFKYFPIKKDKLYSLVKKKVITHNEIYKLKHSQERIQSSMLMQCRIKLTDTFWYIHGLNEIFIEEVYRFQSDYNSPFIIDCGANIGLSIIYLKNLYPKAKIIGFEPDNEIFEILNDNIAQFKFNDIELQNKAIWINNEPLFFKQNGSVGGHIVDEEGQNTIKIETHRLKDLLNQNVDFLKIDIEGVEYEILKDCEEKLQNVKNIFVEYHSFHENDQMIGELLIILKNAGFKIYIKEAWENMKNPFIEKKGPYFDLQLNIFGYRR